MSCVHMSIHDFPQIMSSSSILKSPGGSRVGRQASNKQAVKQASTWGGHLVGAMPYRGLLSHYLAPRAQAGPGGDMTTCVGVTLTGILRTMSLPKKKIN